MPPRLASVARTMQVVPVGQGLFTSQSLRQVDWPFAVLQVVPAAQLAVPMQVWPAGMLPSFQHMNFCAVKPSLQEKPPGQSFALPSLQDAVQSEKFVQLK